MNMIEISVKELIAFVLRSGDIDQRFSATSQTRAMDGIKAHQAVQKEYTIFDRAEVFFKDTTDMADITFHVQGRADGVLKTDTGYAIDEIKSTDHPMKEIVGALTELHWAQAKCYGYFLAKQMPLDAIDIQLTYYHIETKEIKRFKKTFDFEDLQDFYFDVLSRYVKITKWRLAHLEERRDTLQALSFPFASYRKGQRELAEAVYTSILRRHHLFVEAPTGIGKTVSTLFPMLKAMGEGHLEQAFYLTARSTQKAVALRTLGSLQRRGAKLISLEITAKEKICLNDKVSCNPKDCPYAKGHYDRINDALLEILKEAEMLDADEIQEAAEKYRVCPFELSLDLALFSDCIVCDYNYVFHPQMYLRRFFDMKIRPYGFLIDEAHNLIDRGRDMYTAHLDGNLFNDVIGVLPEEYSFVMKSMFKVMKKLDVLFVGDQKHTVETYPDDFYYPLRKVMKDVEVYLAKEGEREEYDMVLEFYFALHRFTGILERYTDGFTTIVDPVEYTLTLFCLDTSEVLREAIMRARTAVFFSATLSPLHFYKRMLGGREESFVLQLASPFPQEKLWLGEMPLSTRYKDRGRTVPEIARALAAFTTAKPGNYLLFFPSYAYLNQVQSEYEQLCPDQEIVVQEPGLSEDARQKFLGQFTTQSTKVGFCVLGGVFSEGIDLIGDRLIGAAVVSVGIPGISYERDRIRDYFEHKEGAGYLYAYVYPGLVKVLQAAGRVIRTEVDRGAVLLVDDRYEKDPYPALYPPHWTGLHGVSLEALPVELDEFWNAEGEQNGET